MWNLFHPLPGLCGEQYVELCFVILSHLTVSPKAGSDVETGYI